MCDNPMQQFYDGVNKLLIPFSIAAEHYYVINHPFAPADTQCCAIVDEIKCKAMAVRRISYELCLCESCFTLWKETQ